MKGVFRGLLVIGAWSLVILAGYLAVLLKRALCEGLPTPHFARPLGLQND